MEDGEPARLDVSGNFTDPNGDSLTFEAQSSDESVATVSMDGSTVTVTPVGAGTASITVTRFRFRGSRGHTEFSP